METSVTIISDTHCRHEELELPAGDLLIHCGDMFNLSHGPVSPLSMMDAWFGRQPFERILYTGGNHDRALEPRWSRPWRPFRNARFLKDDLIEFRGLKIYGSPWVPDLPGHAFSKDRPGLARAWAKIPPGIDILVTHTPPKGILDTSSRGQSFGCAALAHEMARIRPRVHCFGHVHASAGRRQIGDTLFINAASIESGTGRIRPPVTFTLTSATG